MLRTLRIENFLCFQAFELQQLGRLNLLVGTNNSGKTSVLEAVQLLNSRFNQELLRESLREVMIHRGEYILNDERADYRELDVRHLFYAHEINVGSKFSILGDTHNDTEQIVVSVEQKRRRDSSFEDLREPVLVIEWSGQKNEPFELRLSPNEGLRLPLDSNKTFF